MRILVAHNFYQQPGGEDQSFAAEVQALREGGQEVQTYTCHNDAINGMGRLTIAGKTIWNRQTHGELRGLCRSFRPDVVHFNNTFPLISPSAYYACRREGVAVVQSLRNYRLLCAAATFYRDGKVCEDCLGKAVPWPAVAHKCYRDNLGATVTSAAMLTTHRMIGTYSRAVDRYIAISEFVRRKFVEAGFDPQHIAVKPNCVHPDPGVGSGGGGFALFVGRLAPEKGLMTLLEAWRKLEAQGLNFPLHIVGNGPEAQRVEEAVKSLRSVRWLGRKTPEEIAEMAKQAECLVFPSEWYETFGRVAVEAYAAGTPVIASRIGAIEELVDEGRTGFLFEAGNAEDLVGKVKAFVGTSLEERERMRGECRREYEAKYTAERNYPMLMAIYRDAIARAQARGNRKHELVEEEEIAEATGITPPH